MEPFRQVGSTGHKSLHLLLSRIEVGVEISEKSKQPSEERQIEKSYFGLHDLLNKKGKGTLSAQGKERPLVLCVMYK